MRRTVTFILLAVLGMNAGATEQLRGAESITKHQQHIKRMSGQEGRVEQLSKAFGLDASQTHELRQILNNQREQVRRIWSDEAVLPAYRVAATQAASDRTGDAIRSILNDEQKQKYNMTRPPQDLTAASVRRSIAIWMDAVPRE